MGISPENIYQTPLGFTNLDISTMISLTPVLSESIISFDKMSTITEASGFRSESIVYASSRTHQCSIMNSNIIPSIGNKQVITTGSTYIPASRQIPNIPIDQHQLNVDSNPVVIRKKPAQRVQHIQNVSLKFLKPLPLPQPGDITIIQEPDIQMPAAPALYVTQEPLSKRRHHQ